MVTAPLLYLITPPVLADIEGFARDLRDVLSTAATSDIPVACLQLRLKGVDDVQVIEASNALQPVLAEYDVALIINDSAEIARKVGADGVHLGQGDGSIAEARKILGKDADIGITCHDSYHLAMVGAEAGADYVAFGAFFPTDTKVTTHRPDPELIEIWTQMTTVPCVAIGGITAANAGVLVRAGADYLAVSGAVWNHEEGPAAGVRAFADILREPAGQP